MCRLVPRCASDGVRVRHARPGRFEYAVGPNKPRPASRASERQPCAFVSPLPALLILAVLLAGCAPKSDRAIRGRPLRGHLRHRVEVAHRPAAGRRGRGTPDQRSPAARGSGHAGDAAEVLGGRAAQAHRHPPRAALPGRAGQLRRLHARRSRCWSPTSASATSRPRPTPTRPSGRTSATPRGGRSARVEDYRHWIAQMQDIPRYFHEQMDEMRAGLKRGFTPAAGDDAGARRLAHRGDRGNPGGEPVLHALRRADARGARGPPGGTEGGRA